MTEYEKNLHLLVPGAIIAEPAGLTSYIYCAVVMSEPFKALNPGSMIVKLLEHDRSEGTRVKFYPVTIFFSNSELEYKSNYIVLSKPS
jgi:hypothetical protein